MAATRPPWRGRIRYARPLSDALDHARRRRLHIFAHGYQYTFGTLTPAELLGYTTGEFLGTLVDQGKLKKGLKVAMALENTDHGVDYGRGIEDWLKQHPGYFNVVFSEKFDLGGTDFSGLLQKVKAAKADIFLADAHLQDYITMHRQYIQSGMHHQMISYGARGPEPDARKALGDGVDYIFAGIWWSDKLPYPQVKKFDADYQGFAGHEPDSYYPAPAYDAMRGPVHLRHQVAGALQFPVGEHVPVDEAPGPAGRLRVVRPGDAVVEQPARRPQLAEQEREVAGQLGLADVLGQPDRADRVEPGLGHVPVVQVADLGQAGQPGSRLDRLLPPRRLLGGQGDAKRLDPVLAGGVPHHAAPAAADVQQPHPGPEPQLPGDQVVLVVLRLLQRGVLVPGSRHRCRPSTGPSTHS